MSAESNKDSKFELTSIYKEKTSSKNIPFDLNLIDNLEKNAGDIAIEIHRMVASLQNKLNTVGVYIKINNNNNNNIYYYYFFSVS